MAKYKYPCVFVEVNGEWMADFPDWHKTIIGFTNGKTWPQVKYMAEDLLNLMCLTAEEDNIPFPKPSENIIGAGSVVRMIEADTDEYAKAVEQCARVGRYRMAERARERYWYHRPPLTPEEDV